MVHVDDHQNAFTRLYSDDVVTPLAGDLVYDSCMIWQDVLAPMRFLKAYDVILDGQPCEVLCFNSLEIWEEAVDPRSPLVFHETQRKPPAGKWTHVSRICWRWRTSGGCKASRRKR